MADDLIIKNITVSGSTYGLQSALATAQSAGSVKPDGETIVVDGNGVISATGLVTVTASDIDSETTPQGQVLTSDGNGGTVWGQGGSGASTWSEVDEKPFESIGSGLAVSSSGVLSATGGGAGGADWNAQEGEFGFIENKPFDVETNINIISDLVLAYSESLSQEFGDKTCFGDESTTVEITYVFKVGDILSVSYNDKIVEEELVSYYGQVFTKTYLDITQGNIHNGLLLLSAGGNNYIVAVIDDTITAEVGDSITINITKDSITKLSADKIDIDATLKSNNGTLLVNTDGTVKEIAHDTIYNGGLNSALGLGVNVGDGLYLSNSIFKVPQQLWQPAYDAEVSVQAGHIVYTANTDGCLCSLGIAETQLSLMYNTSGGTKSVNDTFKLLGLSTYGTTNYNTIISGGELPQLPFMALYISPSGCTLYIVDDELPAETNTIYVSPSGGNAMNVMDVSVSPASSSSVGGIILGEGLEVDSTTQKTNVSASASTTLGGIKTYFDTTTGTLYVRTDGQDAQPSNP